MKFLYNLGITFYVFIIHLLSPINKKARCWVRGRKHVFESLKRINKTKKTAWFHVASLGEFEQARPVIESFKEKYPSYQIVLTFFSPSGYEIRKNYAYADGVFYLPKDTKKNAKKFISTIQPNIVFFVKYEFWYHYLNELNKQKIPTYLFSAIFRKNQLFFKSYGKWYRKMLGFFSFIFVQNQASEKLLKSVQINNVSVAGDTRFDRVWQIVQSAKQLPEIEIFCDKKTSIVAGSTWEKDEELLLNYLKTNSEIKLIVVPHEVEEVNIKRLEKLGRGKTVRFSERNKHQLQDYQVLIIDSVGLLSAIYRYADIAYIGGGFGKGIHNTLEAAAYGKPVLFGTNYHKFQEAKDLIEREAGFSIKNQNELNHKIEQLITNKSYLEQCGKNASDYVKQMCGGTSSLLEEVEIQIPKD